MIVEDLNLAPVIDAVVGAVRSGASAERASALLESHATSLPADAAVALRMKLPEMIRLGEVLAEQDVRQVAQRLLTGLGDPHPRERS